jgi:ribosomal protein S18 acetylase RimI-like enzyme
VILENDEPVGRLYVERSENEINILDITVHPGKRNAGIGNYLIRNLLEEAGRGNKTVGIYVESFNPSRELFKRLGFVETEQDGFQIHLLWHPHGIAHTNNKKEV